MDLLAELEAEYRVKRMRCGVGLWLDTLTDEERAAVNALLLSSYPSSAVRAKLAEHWSSFDVNADTVQRHRRHVRDGGEGCQCQRPTS